MLEKIIELIKLKDFTELKVLLEDSPNADISECLDELSGEEAAIVFRLLPKDEAADIFSYMESDTQEKLVALLTDKEIGDIISNLFADDAAELINEMPANIVTKILKNTSADKRKVINELLRYPEDSAGSIMTTEYVDIPQGATVKEAFDRIRKIGLNKETVYICYVLEPRSRRLCGVITVKDMLMHDYEDIVDTFMEDNVVTINTNDDQEEVARMFDKYDFLAMPVVDNEYRLVGIVTIDDAMEIMSDENEEDFEKMAGMQPTDESYFKESVFSQYKNRIVWLLFLMLSSIITGVIIEDYELAFASLPVLVTFIPMLMDTGGNCGSQSSTVIIRGIATGEVEGKDVFKALWKEVRIAVLCGVTLAVANGVRIMIQYHNIQLAIVLGLSLICTVVMAKSLGCLLPLGAKALKLDPAYMASPLITTISDAVSLMIFFNIAVIIMGI